MLTTPSIGLEYHRVRRQELLRSYRPTRINWEHREDR